MAGFFVRHVHRGLGKIIVESSQILVYFFESEEEVCFDKDAFSEGDLVRATIPIGTPCETENCICTIKGKKPAQNQGPHIYEVEYENGLIGEEPETELEPIKLVKSHDPLEVLATLQQEGYPIFKEREELTRAYNDLVRRGAGVKSLLSSRIDLHSHQAYVAGTVILDNKQRYLLADEVGLGKTIEAGIIIHDLLARNPQARILILCPGALVQQWFSEMYSKFSGVVFCLPELSGLDSLAEEGARPIIISFRVALSNKEKLTGQQWDLVVVDEVHHLLRVPSLYELVRVLSLRDRGLLLLTVPTTRDVCG